MQYDMRVPVPKLAPLFHNAVIRHRQSNRLYETYPSTLSNDLPTPHLTPERTTNDPEIDQLSGNSLAHPP